MLSMAGQDNQFITVEFYWQKSSNSNPVVSGLPGKPDVIIVSYKLTRPDFSYLQWQMPECRPSEL